jgi:hypothetical protein
MAKEAGDAVLTTNLDSSVNRSDGLRCGYLVKCAVRIHSGIYKGKCRWIVMMTVAMMNRAGKIGMTELSYISSLTLVYRHSA